MSSIAEELTEDEPRCKICRYLRSLDVDLAWQWAQGMDKPVEEVPNVNVVRALGRRKVLVSEATVRRHRRHA